MSGHRFKDNHGDIQLFYQQCNLTHHTALSISVRLLGNVYNLINDPSCSIFRRRRKDEYYIRQYGPAKLQHDKFDSVGF